MLTDWDHREVQGFDALENIGDTEVRTQEPEDLIAETGTAINSQLDLPATEMTADQS